MIQRVALICHYLSLSKQLVRASPRICHSHQPWMGTQEEKDEAKFPPGTHGTGFLPRADPGATCPPKSRAATDCWREDKVG